MSNIDLGALKENTDQARTWFARNMQSPITWFAIGFITCKVLDVYLENSKRKRLSP